MSGDHHDDSEPTPVMSGGTPTGCGSTSCIIAPARVGVGVCSCLNELTPELRVPLRAVVAGLRAEVQALTPDETVEALRSLTAQELSQLPRLTAREVNSALEAGQNERLREAGSCVLRRDELDELDELDDARCSAGCGAAAQGPDVMCATCEGYFRGGVRAAPNEPQRLTDEQARELAVQLFAWVRAFCLAEGVQCKESIDYTLHSGRVSDALGIDPEAAYVLIDAADGWPS